MSKNTLKSVTAVLAGFIAVVVLSLGTDVMMHAAGVFPQLGQPMSDALFLLSTLYRTVYCIAGSYIAARVAPDRPMGHALALGVVGLVFSTVGAVVTWNKGPEFGPHWYPVALIVTAIPCAWLGGKLRVMQLRERVDG
jgi:surface polysaccharide O-acyltransferase-like enzyme